MAFFVCAWASVSSPALSHETLTTTVLFDREIVRILNKHCVMCHVENGPSFPLETYEQTWLEGRKIRSNVLSRHMPPWAAVPGYGEFANDNSLTLRETQFIVSWVEGLGPRNSGTVFTNVVDTAGTPRVAVRAKADFSHGQLGEPSRTFQLERNTIDPGKPDFVKLSIIDLNLTEPQRIRAIEFMPGDRRVARAAFFTIQETGQWIGSWTPWYGFTELPAAAAFRVPAGAHIVAEMHYRSAKESVEDRGTLALFFSDKPTPNTMSDLVVGTKQSADGKRYRGQTTLTTDLHVAALRLEIPAGVKSVEVSSRNADGTANVLLFAKDIPKGWPTPYIFKEPVLIRRGSVLSVTAYGGTVKLTVSKY